MRLCCKRFTVCRSGPAIGSVGGKKVRSTKGPDFYRDIGRRGGQTTRARLGLEHYARIGRMGGLRRKKRQPGSADSAHA